MASKWETTPILLKHGDKDYGILDIVYAPDNSIYFTFPSSRKRIISEFNEKEYDNVEYKEEIRELKSFENNSIEPKVSFHAPNATHPDSTIVHINSNIIGKITSDYKVLDVGVGKETFIYLMQIVVPKNLSFFDEYVNKHHHKKRVEIDYEKLDGETLTFEIIIHSSKINRDNYYLPYSKNRKIHNQIYFETNNDLTCSIIISTLDNSKNIKEPEDFLLLVINTDEVSGIYKIVNER